MSKRVEIPETRSTQQNKQLENKSLAGMGLTELERALLRAKLEAKGERWERLVASGIAPAYLLEDIKKAAGVE